MSHANRATPLLADTDKVFWHRYLDFYERHLPAAIEGRIVEFGVFHGNSIRWLAERFPDARVVGCDILPIQPEWPRSERIEYREVDQDDETAVVALMSEYNDIDLIIEDGSHLPRHQSRCLVAGLSAIRDGGLYLLEDIHTSHPEHPMYRAEYRRRPGQTAYSVLLAIGHLKEIGAPWTAAVADSLRGPYFRADELAMLFRRTAQVAFYRRSTLPLACWRCGSSEFDYLSLKCTCGEPLLATADSMTIAIHVAALET
jgi:hypothetical protein